MRLLHTTFNVLELMKGQILVMHEHLGRIHWHGIRIAGEWSDFIRRYVIFRLSAHLMRSNRPAIKKSTSKLGLLAHASRSAVILSLCQLLCHFICGSLCGSIRHPLCHSPCHSVACFVSRSVGCSTYLVIRARRQLDQRQDRLRVQRGGLCFILMLCGYSLTRCGLKLSLPTLT